MEKEMWATLSHPDRRALLGKSGCCLWHNVCNNRSGEIFPVHQLSLGDVSESKAPDWPKAKGLEVHRPRVLQREQKCSSSSCCTCRTTKVLWTVQWSNIILED